MFDEKNRRSKISWDCPFKSETKKSKAKWRETKTFWKRKKAKIRCIYFALVGSEKFEAQRSEMKQKNNNFFSRERAKRMRNGSRFTSFRFEAKKILKRNRRTLLSTHLPSFLAGWLIPFHHIGYTKFIVLLGVKRLFLEKVFSNHSSRFSSKLVFVFKIWKNYSS